MLKKDIETLEKVRRRFTKRIPGLKDLTYCQRLARLKLDSLELRRDRLDLIFTYKLVLVLSAKSRKNRQKVASWAPSYNFVGLYLRN